MSYYKSGGTVICVFKIIIILKLVLVKSFEINDFIQNILNAAINIIVFN